MSNFVPQPYSISVDERYIRQRKVDNVSASVVYIGEHMSATALDTSGGWRIKRITVDGSVVTEQVAQDGQFTCVWANRTSYFPVPPTPPFSSTKSLLFDGTNDYLTTTTLSHFRYERTDVFSLALWVNFEEISGTRNLVTNKAQAASSRGWGLRTVNALPTFYLTYGSSNAIIVATQSTLNLYTWYHIAVTYNGSSLASGVQIYVNGVQQPVTIVQNNLTQTILPTNNVVFGASTGLNDFFDGYMDELAFYNTVLTQADVAAIYNSGNPPDLLGLPSASNLISWYRLGEGDIYPAIFDSVGPRDLVMTNMIPGNITTFTP